MTRVTLICKTCGHMARRSLTFEPGSRGTHETSSEPALCPNGHGLMVRKDGVQQERWAIWATFGTIFQVGKRIVSMPFRREFMNTAVEHEPGYRPEELSSEDIAEREAALMEVDRELVEFGTSELEVVHIRKTTRDP